MLPRFPLRRWSLVDSSSDPATAAGVGAGQTTIQLPLNIPRDCYITSLFARAFDPAMAGAVNRDAYSVLLLQNDESVTTQFFVGLNTLAGVPEAPRDDALIFARRGDRFTAQFRNNATGGVPIRMILEIGMSNPADVERAGYGRGMGDPIARIAALLEDCRTAGREDIAAALAKLHDEVLAGQAR